MNAKLFPIGASLAFAVAMAMVPPAHAAGPMNSANPACGNVAQSGGEGGSTRYATGEGGNPKYAGEGGKQK